MGAGLGRRHDAGTQILDEGDGLLYQLRIAGQHTLFKIEVVLQADPGVAAQQESLRHHGHLMAADAEGRPMCAGRQLVAHGQHGLGVGLGAPGDAQAKLEQRIAVDQTFLLELAGEPHVTQVEALELRLDPSGLYQAGMFAQPVGRIDIDHVAEVEAAAIQGAQLR